MIDSWILFGIFLAINIALTVIILRKKSGVFTDLLISLAYIIVNLVLLFTLPDLTELNSDIAFEIISSIYILAVFIASRSETIKTSTIATIFMMMLFPMIVLASPSTSGLDIYLAQGMIIFFGVVLVGTHQPTLGYIVIATSIASIVAVAVVGDDFGWTSILPLIGLTIGITIRGGKKGNPIQQCIINPSLKVCKNLCNDKTKSYDFCK